MYKLYSIAILSAGILVPMLLCASADQVEQIVRIATFDKAGQEQWITVPSETVGKFKALKNMLHYNGEIDFRRVASQDGSLSYESLNKVLDCVRLNPENIFLDYKKYADLFKSKDDCANFWYRLDYLEGPVELRLAVANHIISKHKKACDDFNITLLRATVRSLHDALRCRRRGSHEGARTLDLSDSNISQILPIGELGEEVCHQNFDHIERLDLSNNHLTWWDRKSSRVIADLFKGLRELDISNNLIEEIDYNAFRDLPGGIHVNVQNNRIGDRGIPTDSCTNKNKNMIIDLRGNHISLSKAKALQKEALRRTLQNILWLHRTGVRVNLNRMVDHGAFPVYLGAILIGAPLTGYALSLLIADELAVFCMGNVFVGTILSPMFLPERDRVADLLYETLLRGEEYRENELIFSDKLQKLYYDSVPSIERLRADLYNAAHRLELQKINLIKKSARAYGIKIDFAHLPLNAQGSVLSDIVAARYAQEQHFDLDDERWDFADEDQGDEINGEPIDQPRADLEQNLRKQLEKDFYEAVCQSDMQKFELAKRRAKEFDQDSHLEDWCLNDNADTVFHVAAKEASVSFCHDLFVREVSFCALIRKNHEGKTFGQILAESERQDKYYMSWRHSLSCSLLMWGLRGVHGCLFRCRPDKN